jgi:hypothetical protein
MGQRWHRFLLCSFGARELIFKFDYTCLVSLLLCLGNLIVRVFSQVRVVGNCLLDTLNETWPLDRDAVPQLTFKSRVPGGGHRNFDDCCQLGSGDLGLACRPFHAVLYNIDNALPLYVVTPAIDSDLWDTEPAETCHEANCFCGAIEKNFDNLFF